MNPWLTRGKMLVQTGMGLATQKVNLPFEFVVGEYKEFDEEIMLRCADGKKVAGGSRFVWDKPTSGVYKGKRFAIKQVKCREYASYIIYLPRDDD